MKIPERILKKVEKPARYTGGEWGQIVKDKNTVDVRFAFCFPDTYEIGMSNLGVRILYDVLNARADTWCERVYAPWVDMEAGMREEHIPLWAHESGDPVSEFDIVGFSLQYELCYTNVLNMLELAGIPLLAAERGDDAPVVVGGGPCTYNAEPIADYFDLFMRARRSSASWFPFTRNTKSGAFGRRRFCMRRQRSRAFMSPLFMRFPITITARSLPFRRNMTTFR